MLQQVIVQPCAYGRSLMQTTSQGRSCRPAKAAHAHADQLRLLMQATSQGTHTHCRTMTHTYSQTTAPPLCSSRRSRSPVRGSGYARRPSPPPRRAASPAARRAAVSPAPRRARSPLPSSRSARSPVRGSGGSVRSPPRCVCVCVCVCVCGSRTCVGGGSRWKRGKGWGESGMLMPVVCVAAAHDQCACLCFTLE
jgi:hypothetical protein